MEFLKTYQKVSNNFKHSGLATKAGPPEKPNGINSIVPPPLPAGFGVEVPRDVPIKKKLNAENTDMSHITVPNAWKMDPRKAANLYVKKICRDYNSKYQPTAEELRLEEEKKVIIQALTARSKEKLKTTSSPDAQGTQNTRQSEQNIGLQEFRDEDDRELQDERVSPPNESRKDIRPQSATAPVARIVSGDKSRKPHSAMSKNQSAGSIRPVSAVSKRPTSAATTAMPRPDSATTDLPLTNSSPKFKRIQSARRGIEPFEYEVPDENIVEVRCMLHPTIQRAWKAPTDTWFPGRYQRTKELRNQEKQFDSRKADTNHHFQSKILQYNEAEVMEARTKPIVRCASKYIDPQRKQLQDQMEKDQHIINKRVTHNKLTGKEEQVGLPFYTFSKDQIPVAKDSYLNRGEAYRPVSSHQFRDKQREQWVDKNDFRLF